MAKTTELTTTTSLANADLFMVVDVDDTTMAPSGTNKGIQAQNVTVSVPVVQSAYINSTTNSVDWSSESGWAVSSPANGVFTITFPTAAANAEDQSVVAAVARTGTGDTVYTCSISDLTASGCTVNIETNAGVDTDVNFSIIRRLPNVEVALTTV